MQNGGPWNRLVTQAVPSIPIYYFHPFDQPFCRHLLYQRQLNRQATIKLFVQIVEGKLELEKVAEL